MSSNVLTDYVLRSGGTVDVDGTVAKFTDDLRKYVAAKEIESSTIGDAVLTVFKVNKSTRINMPALCSLVANKLNVQPENFNTMNERIADYVRANSVQKGGKLFNIARGKNGGVSLAVVEVE